ncbi:MAG TPA: cbb3-type cytochrome c oxidase subunit 3 [Telluria sp.]|jgi:cytochrome c oxidase cbb3-type subunit IV|nr:cbb3-type cytochrome c oxidase subunit 3 [Telluria sp.]
MDITTLRIAATVACFVTFLGIVWWAYTGRNRERFHEAALIPFDHD